MQETLGRRRKVVRQHSPIRLVLDHLRKHIGGGLSHERRAPVSIS